MPIASFIVSLGTLTTKSPHAAAGRIGIAQAAAQSIIPEVALAEREGETTGKIRHKSQRKAFSLRCRPAMSAVVISAALLGGSAIGG